MINEKGEFDFCFIREMLKPAKNRMSVFENFDINTKKPTKISNDSMIWIIEY